MVPTTVGGYLQSLPNERRVAMARVCSMIRRSARGVRESMRFGIAFYELDGAPIFAVESLDKSLRLYAAERGAKAVTGVDISEKMLQRAKQQTKSEIVTYIQSDLQEVSFLDNSFCSCKEGAPSLNSSVSFFFLFIGNFFLSIFSAADTASSSLPK